MAGNIYLLQQFSLNVVAYGRIIMTRAIVGSNFSAWVVPSYLLCCSINPAVDILEFAFASKAFVHPLPRVQSLIPTHRNHGKNGVHDIVPRIQNTWVDDTGKNQLPTLQRGQVRTCPERAQVRQPHGVERHPHIHTTDEDGSFVSIMHTGEGLSRGERDRIRRLESSVWDARIDDEALVSILFPDSEDSTAMTVVFEMLSHHARREHAKNHLSWAAIPYTRLDAPLRQSTASLSLRQSANVQRSEVHGRLRVTSSHPKLRNGSWALSIPREAAPHAPQPQPRL